MLDLVATHRHYFDHLLPVWRALKSEDRGTAYLAEPLRRFLPGSMPAGSMTGSEPAILVAGFDDVRRAGQRRVVLMEHGCGQSYGGDPVSAGHPAYAGGTGREQVVGFLCPNVYAADRNRAARPDALVEIVGSPRIAALQTIAAPVPRPERPVVAFGFHFDATLCNETMTGWPHWVEAIRKLAEEDEFEILGHAHPRMFRDVAPTYRDMGVEPVEDFQEVLQRAHVLCCDNSSILFEFAWLRGPVVVLDCPWYRPGVDHGLRFWDAADVGPRIMDQVGLPTAIRSALRRQPWPGADEKLARVFPAIFDPAGAAAEAAMRASVLPMKSRGRTYPRTS